MGSAGDAVGIWWLFAAAVAGRVGPVGPGGGGGGGRRQGVGWGGCRPAAIRPRPATAAAVL